MRGAEFRPVPRPSDYQREFYRNGPPDRTVFLNFDYGLSDRVALTVGLPYKAGKFEGPGGHDPHTLYNDHGFDSIDDGDFHSGWQDWRIALRYQMRAAPAWHITPFVAFVVLCDLGSYLPSERRFARMR